MPLSFEVDSFNGDTVSLSWADTANASFQICYGPAGFDPDTVVANIVSGITDTTYTMTGLGLGVIYDFYVRGDCGEEQSFWIGPATVMTGYFYTMDTGAYDTVHLCDVVITDDGGIMGPYTSYAVGTLFVLPTDSTQTFMLSGTADLYPYGGYLRIYDGLGTTGTPLLSLTRTTGVQTFGPLLSEAGAFTIDYDANYNSDSYNCAGFAISATCVPQVNCLRPSNFAARSVNSTSAELEWTERGTATSWQIEYGPHGFTPGSDAGTTETAGSTTYTLSGLEADSVYDIYLSADCGTELSHSTMITIHTPCMPIDTLPFFYGFEDLSSGHSAALNSCWYSGMINPNSYSGNYPYPVSSVHASGNRSLYFYGYYNTKSYAVMPQFEEELSLLEVSFKMRGSGSSYDGFMQVGVMSDPNDPNTFVPVESFSTTNNTTWDSATVYLSAYSGTGRYITFMCYADPATYQYSYVYLDDIKVDYAPDCQPVSNVATEPSATTVVVTWMPSSSGVYAGAEIEYKDAASTDWTSAGIFTGRFGLLSGLTPETQYNIRVTNICEDGEGMPVGTTFFTVGYPCVSFDTTRLVIDTVGNGTDTSTYLPSLSNYEYSLTQQIFRSSDFDTVLESAITHLGIEVGNMNVPRDWDIYLTNTLESSLSSSFIPIRTTDMVWSGSTNFMTSNTWNTIALTTPFSYGGNNILVTIVDHTGTYTYGNQGMTNMVTDGISRYYYSIDSPMDPTNPSQGYSSSYRNNMVFRSAQCTGVATCMAPALAVAEVGSDAATIAWAAGLDETSWELYYRQVGATSWISVGTVTGNSYTLNGLSPGSGYEVMLENRCTNDTLSSTATFSTACSVISTLPFSENFNNWGSGTGVIPNCWNKTGSYDSYPQIYNYYNRNATTGGCLSMYLYDYYDEGYHTHISLPEVDTTAIQLNETQVVFFARPSSSNHGIVVGVMSDPTMWSTFVPVDTVRVPSTGGEWIPFEVPLSRYAGNGTYVTLALNTFGDYSGSLYLDDLSLEAIPTCPRPDSLTAYNYTTTGVTLDWHETGTATEWEIEYGPIGFAIGTGTRVIASSKPYTLALPSSYDGGEYYVRGICSSTDTGDFSRIPMKISTRQVPATVPYNYDFEDSTEWSNWQTSSNMNINWYRGTGTPAYSGTNSMYISANGGVTPGTIYSQTINAVAYRTIDFGAVDTSFDLFFRFKVGGTVDYSYNGIVVAICDTTMPVESSDTYLMSPWGDVNAMNYLAYYRLDTSWAEAQVPVESMHGVKQLVFYYFNYYYSSYYTNIDCPVVVDDIRLNVSPCIRPTALAVDSSVLQPTSIGLRWDGPAASQYRVVYREADSTPSANRYVTANTNNVVLTGLTAATTYYVWVQKICGDDSSLFSDGIAFLTPLCGGGSSFVLGEDVGSTSTVNYYPVSNSYQYSVAEFIVDSAELGGARTLSGIGFYYTSSSPMTQKTNVDIYLKPTDREEFGYYDYENVDSTAVLVYSGSLNCSQGWNLFAFDTSYDYSGNGSLMVIVDDNSGSFDGYSYYFRNRSVSGYLYKTMYYYSSTTNPSVTDLGSFTEYGKSRAAYRPEVQFISCPPERCPDPIITGLTNTFESATLAWTGSGNAYQVSIKESSATAWPDANIAVTGNTYTFTGLTPATHYMVRVRQDCEADSNGYSEWVYDAFVTDSLPCLAPSSLSVSGLSNAQGTFAWEANGNEAQWDLHVWFAGGLDTVYRVATNPVTVGGFMAGVTYNAAVRAICGSIELEGDYSDTITFTTLTCPDVTGLSASNVTYNSVTLDWAANAMAENWLIEYGHNGFAQGNGTTVVATENTYVITGLEDETTYDFYVKAVCGADWNSEGWAHIQATTSTRPTNTYVVTVTVNDPTMGTVTGGGEFTGGETCTLTATPNAGFEFVNWSNSETANPYSFEVTGDVTLQANFRQLQSIDHVDAESSFVIYPNPTSQSTTISVKGVSGTVKISIVDMSGRTIASEMLECGGDCEKTMSVDNLSQGAYFVRIVGDSLSMVKKLIVR